MTTSELMDETEGFRATMTKIFLGIQAGVAVAAVTKLIPLNFFLITLPSTFMLAFWVGLGFWIGMTADDQESA